MKSIKFKIKGLKFETRCGLLKDYHLLSVGITFHIRRSHIYFDWVFEIWFLLWAIGIAKRRED